MIRVQLGVGFAALLLISYSAVEHRAVSIVDATAEEVAVAKAREALALGRAAWSENLERQRGLTHEAASRLADGPASVVAALNRQLGHARVFVLDRDKKVLAQGGEAASSPPGGLPGVDLVRPGTTMLHVVAAQKPLVVAVAGAPDGRIVATVRQIAGADLLGWLGGSGEGDLQLGLAAKGGAFTTYSAGEATSKLEADGSFRSKDDRFRFVKAELHDDVGEPLELVGFGRVDSQAALQMAGLLKTSWIALGIAGLLMLVVVVPVVARVRTKERAMEGFQTGDIPEFRRASSVPESDPDDGWSEVALATSEETSEPTTPEPMAEEPITDLSRTLPPPEGHVSAMDSQAMPPPEQRSMTLPPSSERVASAPPEAQIDAALHAYLPPASTPPAGYGGPGPEVAASRPPFAAQPMGAFDSRLPVPEPDGELADPYAHGYAPEYASEIQPFHDPRYPDVTRGQGTSPPPRPVGAGSAVPGVHGSGFSTAYPAAPLASAAPITRTPQLRASYPAPGFEDVRPFDLEHYRLVYNEFVESKRRLGEMVDNVTLEGFSAKLRKSEQQLIDKHGCRAVRFQVLLRNRQVSLRPQLVR